jgi:5-methylcytosine-specific restriction endonuclease McrA
MKEEILRLRSDGKSYKQIRKILGCSLGTISYHCGKGQKEKNLERANRRAHLHALGNKVDRFQKKKQGPGRRQCDKSSTRKQLQDKADGFQRSRENGKCGKHLEKTFTYKDVLQMYGEETTCYLTGRPIKLLEPRMYEFDHKIPVSKGGKHTIDNLGITRKEANWAKADMTINDFIELCKDVLGHNGYTVTENES